MIVKDYITKHSKLLKMFKGITLILNGNFYSFASGEMAQELIIQEFGNNEYWNVIARNNKMYLFLESTNDNRGGGILKSYIFKNKLNLKECEGINLWFSEDHRFYSPTKIEKILEYFGESEIIDIKINRDFVVNIQIRHNKREISLGGANMEYLEDGTIKGKRVVRT